MIDPKTLLAYAKPETITPSSTTGIARREPLDITCTNGLHSSRPGKRCPQSVVMLRKTWGGTRTSTDVCGFSLYRAELPTRECFLEHVGMVGQPFATLVAPRLDYQTHPLHRHYVWYALCQSVFSREGDEYSLLTYITKHMTLIVNDDW